MQDLELLLRSDNRNFLLLDEINENSDIEFLNFKKILLVTDKNLINVNKIFEFLKILKNKYNVKVITVDSSEPNYAMIESTSKKIFSDKYNLVIALGGGSILDIVKASSMYENSIEPVDNFVASKKNYRKKLIKTLAIPTTAGTGSEFTHTSVYKTRSNIKNWLWDELTFFDYTIYIPSLTLDLPKNITIASGIDAFDHLIESLISVKFNYENIDMCNYGMGAIWESLPDLIYNDKDISLRKNMLLSSGLAGKAIHLTGCGICHCIAHTLGSLTKIPHGTAVAYALLHTIEPVLYYEQDLLKRFKGPFNNFSTKLLAKNIQDWINNLRINYDLIEKKINLDEFLKIYFLEDNKSMRDNTYYQPSKFDLKSILQGLWN